MRLFLALSLRAALWGQGERGAFHGTVTDSTGSVVPGTVITAQNTRTNVEARATTTDAGVYRMPYLAAGTYRISARKPGFRTAVRDNVVLSVAQTLTVDFTLRLGALTELVTVPTPAPLLESSTSEVGRYVSRTEFNTWPVPVADGHRQIQQFIFAALPGSVGDTFQGSINGGQWYSHEILIEGVALGRMDFQGGSNNEFSPSAESVAEFKLQTGVIGAQYGGGQTAVANFALRSGGNQVHGDVFTYVQNDALRANSFGNNALGRERPPFKLFNWGYGAGGPVYLPKLYDGRNQTFWHVTLEKTRQRDFGTNGLGTVPTLEFKQGDFSRLLDPNFTGRADSGAVLGTDAAGRSIRYGQIYDPASTRALPNGGAIRDPFPGNVLPRSRWDPVARKILELAPITDPIRDSMLNNVSALTTCCPVFDESILGAKVDHVFGPRHRLAAYYNHQHRLRNSSPPGRWGLPPESPTGVYQLQETPSRLVRVAGDWTIHPALLNHFAAGYNRFGNLNQSVYADQGWPAQIGLQHLPGTHFPVLTFGGAAYQGGGIGAGGRLGSAAAGGSVNGSTILTDDVTFLHGAHNFKAGVEHRRYYFNDRGRSNDSGTFNFQPTQTALPGYADSTGHAFASFLLGAVNQTNRTVAASYFGYRSRETAVYFLDDWKVNRKLTLNLGVRWEMIGPLNEVAGRMSALDPNLANPAAANRPGALVFAGNLGRKSFMNPYRGMIQPRAGFAYAATPSLVVRGGYSLSSTPPILDGLSLPDRYGYNGSINLNPANTALRFPQDPVLYLSDPYPSFRGSLPNLDITQANGLAVTYVAPDANRPPYVQNYSLGIQYQPSASFTAEISYLGAKGTRLRARGMDPLNQLPAAVLQFGDRLIEPLSRTPLVAPVPYPGFNGTLAQALRTFPQYLGVSQLCAPFGASNYDSLQVSVTRRYSNGLAVLAAYTFSKALAIEDSAVEAFGIQDVYNPRLDRSVTAYNIPHFLKLSWIYDLPTGRGKILGGWSLTGNHQYRSGAPLAPVTSSLRTDAMFNGTLRPDLLTGVPLVIYDGGPVAFGTGTPYLNPAAFAQVPHTGNNVPLRLGTAPRYLPDVRGFHRFGEDFGVMKKVPIREGYVLEIRADFFNAFNRAGRGDPVMDVTSPLFGKVTGAQRGPRSIQLEGRFRF